MNKIRIADENYKLRKDRAIANEVRAEEVAVHHWGTHYYDKKKKTKRNYK